MSEINNNIHNYGYNIERINLNKDSLPKQQTEVVKEEEPEKKYVPDTGILGRSQIKGLKGGNIEKSVDETVYMAKNEPAKLKFAVDEFDKLYEEGHSYENLLLGMDEFYTISDGYKK